MFTLHATPGIPVDIEFRLEMNSDPGNTSFLTHQNEDGQLVEPPERGPNQTIDARNVHLGEVWSHFVRVEHAPTGEATITITYSQQGNRITVSEDGDERDSIVVNLMTDHKRIDVEVG
jgi:hypothetical protein